MLCDSKVVYLLIYISYVGFSNDNGGKLVISFAVIACFRFVCFSEDAAFLSTVEVGPNAFRTILCSFVAFRLVSKVSFLSMTVS